MSKAEAVIGVIYDIHDGLLKQPGIEYRSQQAWESSYGEAFTS